MTATYTNTQTNEVYKLGGIKNISDAWNRSSLVCNRNGWNEDMFASDVTVTVK